MCTVVSESCHAASLWGKRPWLLLVCVTADSPSVCVLTVYPFSRRNSQESACSTVLTKVRLNANHVPVRHS